MKIKNQSTVDKITIDAIMEKQVREQKHAQTI